MNDANIVPQVLTEVVISYVKHLNGRTMWYTNLDAFQANEWFQSRNYKSQSGQETIDWVRAWHIENEVSVRHCKMRPGIEVVGYFGTRIDYSDTNAVFVNDIFSDGDFIMARLSIGHD